MSVALPGRKSNRLLSLAATCAFFGAFYAYVLLCLQPRLLYFADTLVMPSGRAIDFPLFLKGMDFLREFLGRPGGICAYLAAWCSQYFCYAHGGALILTVMAFLAFASSGRLMRRIGGAVAGSVCFVPPLLLLAACNRYTLGLEHCVAPLVALAAAGLYALAVGRLKWRLVRGLVVAAASVALYAVAGKAAVLFVTLCALVEFPVIPGTPPG